MVAFAAASSTTTAMLVGVAFVAMGVGDVAASHAGVERRTLHVGSFLTAFALFAGLELYGFTGAVLLLLAAILGVAVVAEIGPEEVGRRARSARRRRRPNRSNRTAARCVALIASSVDAEDRPCSPRRTSRRCRSRTRARRPRPAGRRLRRGAAAPPRRAGTCRACPGWQCERPPPSVFVGSAPPTRSLPSSTNGAAFALLAEPECLRATAAPSA